MKELFDLCPSKVKIWKEFPDGSHNDTVAEPGYFECIENFIKIHVEKRWWAWKWFLAFRSSYKDTVRKNYKLSWMTTSLVDTEQRNYAVHTIRLFDRGTVCHIGPWYSSTVSIWNQVSIQHKKKLQTIRKYRTFWFRKRTCSVRARKRPAYQHSQPARAVRLLFLCAVYTLFCFQTAIQALK